MAKQNLDDLKALRLENEIELLAKDIKYLMDGHLELKAGLKDTNEKLGGLTFKIAGMTSTLVILVEIVKSFVLK
jgi:hypothetical protein